MSVLQPIDRYIAATMLNCAERADEEFYRLVRRESSFDRFVDLFKLNLQFKVIYSPSRRVERLRIAGENWLIYDQYLGQTMNILNRIFFASEDAVDAVIYFHKYFAERALESGCPMLGLHFANFYAENREKLRSSAPSAINATKFTMLNERFNIAHELAHELVDAKHSYIKHMMESAVELLDERRKSHTAQTVDSLLELYAVADPAVYFGRDFETFDRDTRIFLEGEDGKAWNAAYLRAIDAPETAIELFCDLMAVDFALERFFERDAGMDEAIRALYVGSYHVRTIAYFDWHCAEILVHKTKLSELAARDKQRLAAMAVRNHCFRDHLLFVYNTHLHEVRAKDINERTAKLRHTLFLDQARYYDRIFDPAGGLLSFASEEGRLEELADSILSRFPDPEKIEFRDVSASVAIAQQTGWPFSLVERLYKAELLAYGP